MNNLLKVLMVFLVSKCENNGKLKKAKLKTGFASFEIIATYVHVLG